MPQLNIQLPVSFEAPVLHGKQLGRKIGTPTLNQPLPEELSDLCFGVYFSRCTVNGISYSAITNIGTAPTVSRGDVVCAESHLFGFEGSVYGLSVKTELLAFHRPEIKFNDINELSSVIEADIRLARNFFESLSDAENKYRCEPEKNGTEAKNQIRSIE